MNLYLIKTERDRYATNANLESGAIKKFRTEYPHYEVLGVRELPVESLVRMEDNEDIIFF